MRTLAALALVLVACGKGKETPSAGSGATGTATGDADVRPVPVEVDLPEVALPGFEEAKALPARIQVTRSAIVVDGKQVVALEAGQLPAVAVVDGRIPAIVGGLSASSSDPRFVVALDRTLSYGLLTAVVATLKSQGVRSFGLLARSNGATVMAPFELPGAAVEASVMPPAGGPTLGASVEVAEAVVTPESSLSGDLVKRKVSGAYVAGIKRCVTEVGTRDATPGGSIALDFVIDETGRGAEGNVTGMPRDIADCIRQTMGSWRFTVPRGPDRVGVRVNAKVILSVEFHRTANSNAPIASRPEEAGAPAVPAAPAPSVRVTITNTAIVILDGAAKQPHATIAVGAGAAREVSAALEALVTARASGSRELVLAADAATAMQTIAQLLGAVRATPAGTPLFPTVFVE